LSAKSVFTRALVVSLALSGALALGAVPALASTWARPGTALRLDMTTARTGYWVVTRGGGVASGGGAPDLGGLPRGTRLGGPVVGMAATPDGRGYWLASSSGGVYSFGDARFFGSLSRPSPARLQQRVIGIAPAGKSGYWLASSQGRIYSFGGARTYGPARYIEGPIVAISATPSGRGYWLVSASGRIFCFGDASYHGSATPGHSVVGFAPTPDGRGYWLATARGRVISFGDATARGSALSTRHGPPFVGIAAERDGTGYWFVDSRGTTFGFGPASATSARGLARGAVAIAADPEAVLPRPAVTASPGVPVQLSSSAIASLDPRAALAVQFALAQVGKPYVWGGTGPDGYDCSGLAFASWAAAGVQLPRTAAAQYWAGAHVPLSEVQPGDLVFWASDPSDPSTIYHVAISLGGQRTVQATHTGSYVQVSGWWGGGMVPMATRP